MKITEARILVFDTETTGVDPAEARIVELGAVAIAAGRSTEKLHTFVNPGCPIPAEVSAIHGVTDADVQDAPSFAELAPRVAERFHSVDVVAGYNAVHYDVPLLNAELARVGSDFQADLGRVLDPVVFIRWHLRHLRERTLGAICVHLGIDLSDAHSAVADSIAAGRVLFSLVRMGLVPDDVDAALGAQAALQAIEQAEGERWTYWLYGCRTDSETLRLGCGKHIGRPLREVDAGYLGFLLRTIEDLPTAVRAEFEDEMRRRRDAGAMRAEGRP